MNGIVKNIFLQSMKTIATLVSGWLVGLLLMLMAYSLPTAPIIDHVKKSVPVLVKEGSYPRVSKNISSNLDNFTDALMLSTAAYEGNEALLDKSLKAYRIGIRGQSPEQALVMYYSQDKKATSQVTKDSYARYWHGYLVPFKTGLCFARYGVLRNYNTVLQTIFTLAICVLLWKRGLAKWIVPYVITIGTLCPEALGKSIQYSSVFYIFSIAIVAFLLNHTKWETLQPYKYYFLIIGMAASFFDLLTYPALTLGIPLSLYLIVNQDEVISHLWKVVAVLCFYWGVGYVGMWAGKWILASILTDQNVIQNAWSAFKFRAAGHWNEKYISVWDVIRVNYDIYTGGTLMTLLKGCITALYVLELVVNGCKLFRSVLVFAPLIIIPIVWYAATRNHSYIHAGILSYKVMSLWTLGALCVVCNHTFDRNDYKRFLEVS